MSGNCVKQIFESQEGAKVFPKLTYRHLNYDTFDKMRVSLAVQILSKSVSKGIELMIDSGFFKTDEEKQEAKNSSIFLSKMNDLFDMLNAKSPDDPNPLKRGISGENIHLLREFCVYVMSLKCRKVYWIEGLQQTVNGIILFFEEKQAKNRSFCLMTRRLNQDALENMFGLIRASGGNNRNPTLLDYLRIVSRILTTSLKISFENSNCEIDENSHIQLMSIDNYECEVIDASLFDDNDEVYFY